MDLLTYDEYSRHLVHSHAHEGDIPGSVYLKAEDGDDTKGTYGQAIFPIPSDDPNDPLQWNNTKKTIILIICCLYSFISNSATLGPSVYIGIWAEEFSVSPSTSSGLLSYPNLAYGFGSLFLVPLYLKIGRRPVMLGSLVVFLAGLIAASQCTTFNSLMISRVIHAFASGVVRRFQFSWLTTYSSCTSVASALVSLCMGATGPLYAGYMLAGYMLAGGYSWRLYFYVEIAFAGALLLAAFFFVEESAYKRATPQEDHAEKPNNGTVDSPTKEKPGDTIHSVAVPMRKSFLQTLNPWSSIDHEVSFLMTMIRPFTYFVVPAVFWVITTYGICIGLGAVTFNYTFPLKITAPPYNWSETNSGLIAVASIIGYSLATLFASSSDAVAPYLTRKNDGVREAEMRLSVMLPAMLIAPAGLVLRGNGDMGFLLLFLVYAHSIDSYYANTSEMLIAMNLGKQAIAFGMAIYLLDWILQYGFAVMIAGVFTGLLLANNLLLLVFMIWGKRIRVWTSKTWLAQVHKSTITQVMGH
ncbi:MFS transporter [Dacryopinax primogenitus]|uniref:MFS transporter n=1 Tax=Dacryopinax primogenitus (strain DJM 731) TaxID=1858805 RepID=M5FTE7_DACPD|nr:MFS transporter [Dacryopinax primogenitus]EJT99333.1 MFS transporter [Dacryopinax primogenitus]